MPGVINLNTSYVEYVECSYNGREVICDDDGLLSTAEARHARGRSWPHAPDVTYIHSYVAIERDRNCLETSSPFVYAKVGLFRMYPVCYSFQQLETCYITTRIIQDLGIQDRLTGTRRRKDV